MGRRPPISKPGMPTRPSRRRAATSRGNRRTREGPGRHNLGSVAIDGRIARVRICLGCDRPFKSRGAWNRFCGRCHQRDEEHEHEGTRAYHLPTEWPADLFADEF